MKSIQILNFKASQTDPAFDSITSVEVDDKPFGSGSFGEVYLCNSINGKPLGRTQVIKRFIDDGGGSAATGYSTILHLQEKMLAYNGRSRSSGDKNIAQMNALQAMPQFSFEGTLDGVRIAGYSANYLDPKRYFLFDKMFNNQDQGEKQQLLKVFYNLPVSRRLKMAFDLAEGFRALQQMSFVHADLNPSNFLVDINEDRLCIIDYDSGAVIENGRNDATTFGKMGEWLAPEIQQQLVQSGTGSIRVDLNTDTWSVAIAIHFLLFHFHPLFYLKKRGISQMEAYFNVNSYRWPEIDKDDTNFQSSLLSLYEKYRAKLKNDIPAGIVECFAETINNGYYKPGLRISYAQWMSRIERQMEPPVIDFFESDKIAVVNGAKARLKWRTDKAHTLVIDNGVGEVTGKRDGFVQPAADTTYTLTAIGHFGEVKKSLTIKVLPLPEMKMLTVPVPSIDVKLEIRIQHPPAISRGAIINVEKIRIPSLPVPVSEMRDRSGPLSLYKKVSAGLKIGSIFDAITNKINTSKTHEKHS